MTPEHPHQVAPDASAPSRPAASGSAAAVPPRQPHDLLALQRLVGNRAVSRLVPSVQRATGLAQGSEREAYTKDAREVLDGWSKLTVMDRQRRLLAAVDQRLKAQNAFPVGDKPGLFSGSFAGGSTYGAFSPVFWDISLRADGFRDDASPETRAQAAETVYHEGRHAEQYSRILRMYAGTKTPPPSAEEISKYMSPDAQLTPVYPPAVEWARGKPLQTGSSATEETKETTHWAASVLLTNTDAVAALDRAIVRLREATAVYKSTLQPLPNETRLSHVERHIVALTAYRSAWTARIDAHYTYANQAHEADAFALGGSVAKALGGTPGLEETRDAFAQKLEELDGLMEDARKARDILVAQLAPAPKAKPPQPAVSPGPVSPSPLRVGRPLPPIPSTSKAPPLLPTDHETLPKPVLPVSASPRRVPSGRPLPPLPPTTKTPTTKTPTTKTPPPVPQRPFQQNLREEDAPRIQRHALPEELAALLNRPETPFNYADLADE